MRIYLGDERVEIDVGIIYLQPFQYSHLVLYVNEIYFVSYGCSPPKKLSKYFIKRNGYCLYSENEIRCLAIQMRFLLCKLIFIYNLLAKNFRNRF